MVNQLNTSKAPAIAPTRRCGSCHYRWQREHGNPTKTAPHHRAPTIDHVIPLAAGGTHEPSNCRTAHFICNSRKGDRGGGEQLAILVV